MKSKRVLIVDDERSIRLTVQRALEPLGVECSEAVNGEEALSAIRRQNPDLVLLDLRMPGMEGLEVLRSLRSVGSSMKVAIITAHGSIDSAVEAMKLGAIDFIQKPFSPDQIRRVVAQAVRRGAGFLHRLQPVTGEDRQRFPRVVSDQQLQRIKAETGAAEQTDYDFCLEQAKAAVEGMDFESAEAWTQKAVSLDSGRPDGFNFLGVFSELRNDRLQAQKYYRAALALEPTYAPAQKNLHRSTQFSWTGTLELGGVEKDSPQGRGLRLLFRRRKPAGKEAG